MKYLAYLMVLTGIVHCALGVVGLPDAVQGILHAGVINGVDQADTKRMLFLWFEVSGISFSTLGYALYLLAKRGGAASLPWAFVLVFVALTTFVVVLFPHGGAWLFLVEGLTLLALKLAARPRAAPAHPKI